MKKGVLLFSIFSVFAVILASSFLIAQEVCEEGDDDCRIDNGYLCLNEKVENQGCSSLSSEEKVFSALATGDCSSDLTLDSKFQSDVKYTSQAVLALGGDSGGEEWLLDDATGTPNQIDWFLQVESTEPSTCTVTYDNNDYVVEIDEDKKLSSGAGSCLDLSSDGYWLKIDSSSSCHDETYEVSCDKSFLTSLLYQKQDSDTIYVAEDTSSASADGTTAEQVNSSCFVEGGSCSYEGSLWAALVLDSLGEDVSSYLPYLITLADENEEFLPEAFLYLLTDDFRTELLSKQKSGKWWEESSGKRYYDTALALYALQYESSPQRTDSIDWLLNEVQGGDGCWNNGNIRDTAFLLYSIDPRDTGTGGGTTCSEAGGHCISSFSCNEAGGNTLSGSCSGTFVCCSEQKVIQTCEEQGGDICSSSQNCVGGTTPQASGLSSGEVCCVQGTCEVPKSDVSACEAAGGTCRISGCTGDEQESFESCDFTSDVCCIQKKTGGVSIIWIVILFILIVLVVIGIIYRERLRKLWFKFKTKFINKFRKGGGKSSSSTTRRGPPRPPGFPVRRRPGPPPRRTIPGPMQSTPKSTKRPKKELDDVLKKLKEIGK